MSKELYTAPDAQMIVFATADIMQGSGNQTGNDSLDWNIDENGEVKFNLDE